MDYILLSGLNLPKALFHFSSKRSKVEIRLAASLQTVSCWLKIRALLAGFSPSLTVTHTVMVRAFYKPSCGLLAAVNHKALAITRVLAVADDLCVLTSSTSTLKSLEGAEL